MARRGSEVIERPVSFNDIDKMISIQIRSQNDQNSDYSSPLKSAKDFNKFHFNRDKIESYRELKQTMAQLKEIKALQLSGLQTDNQLS